MKSKIACLGLILGFLYPKVIAQGQTQPTQSAEESVEKVVEVWVWIETDTALLLDPEERQKLKRWKPYGIADQSLLLYDSESISRISENVLRVWEWTLDKKGIETLSKEMKASSEPSPEEIARQKEMLEGMRQQMAKGKPITPLVLRSLGLIEGPDGTVRRRTDLGSDRLGVKSLLLSADGGGVSRWRA